MHIVENLQRNWFIFYGIITSLLLMETCVQQGSRLVEKAAELRSAGKNYYTLEDCDHCTVCKPSGKDHPSYYLLLDVIRECRQEVSCILEFIFQWPLLFVVDLVVSFKLVHLMNVLIFETEVVSCK
jgi:hypothetical protein